MQHGIFDYHFPDNGLTTSTTHLYWYLPYSMRFLNGYLVVQCKQIKSQSTHAYKYINTPHINHSSLFTIFFISLRISSIAVECTLGFLVNTTSATFSIYRADKTPVRHKDSLINNRDKSCPAGDEPTVGKKLPPVHNDAVPDSSYL